MKILVGFDRSKASEDALNLALQHAQAFNAEVHIMTSLEQGASLKKEDIDKAETQLEKVKKPFKNAGIECVVQTSVSYQSPGEDMVRFAKINPRGRIWSDLLKTKALNKLLSACADVPRSASWLRAQLPSILS